MLVVEDGPLHRRNDTSLHNRSFGGSDVEAECPPAVVASRAMANVEAHITGTVWKIEVAIGDSVEAGDSLVILESMKMEMPVEAEPSGTVDSILCEEGQAVEEGDTLVVLSD